MKRPRPLTKLAAALVTLALLLAGCGGGGEGGEPVAAAEVAIADFDYAPDPITVEVGGTVTWTNEDTAPHTATSVPEAPAEFDTDRLDQGESGEITFDEPGTYEYICTFHPNMVGTVEVVE